MPEKKQRQRDVLEKLGIQPGYAIAFANAVGKIAPDLPRRILARSGRPLATENETLDLVLAVIDETTNTVTLLKQWREHLTPEGGIWLLTAKRGQTGYVDQRLLIAAGQQAEVVDNKICSVSSTVSAMRFVIRKRDRRA
jgi:hypothetical protein